MIEIVIPQVGEAGAEVTLVRWLKVEGDPVEKGEPLFEVDTDKYVIEIEAFDSGTLAEILVTGGSEVMPLQPVGRLAPLGAHDDAPQPPQPPTATTPPGRTQTEDQANVERLHEQASERSVDAAALPRRVLASPKARRVAKDLGIELATLAGRGTGRGGLITAGDVGRARPRAGESLTDAPGQRAVAAESPAATGGLSRMRQLIAERTSASMTEIPHFYLMVETDMTEALRLRRHCSDELGWARAPTITDLILAACARALIEEPRANSSYSPDGLRQRASVDLGIAVGLEDGLVAPVLRDVGSLDLAAIASGTRELIGRAREGQLREADLGGRSLIVSNLGVERIDAFLAIIDLPDPMIVSVGRVTERCVAVEGKPAVRPMCTLGLSVDHRALDGAPAARFLSRVATQLESAFELIAS